MEMKMFETVCNLPENMLLAPATFSDGSNLNDEDIEEPSRKAKKANRQAISDMGQKISENRLAGVDAR